MVLTVPNFASASGSLTVSPNVQLSGRHGSNFHSFKAFVISNIKVKVSVDESSHL